MLKKHINRHVKGENSQKAKRGQKRAITQLRKKTTSNLPTKESNTRKKKTYITHPSKPSMKRNKQHIKHTIQTQRSAVSHTVCTISFINMYLNPPHSFFFQDIDCFLTCFLTTHMGICGHTLWALHVVVFCSLPKGAMDLKQYDSTEQKWTLVIFFSEKVVVEHYGMSTVAWTIVTRLEAVACTQFHFSHSLKKYYKEM